MKPKRLGLAAAMTAVVGCTPTQSSLRRDLLVPAMTVGMAGRGQIIAPKRCDIWMAVVSRPLRDESINDAIWRLADEQAITPEARRALEANGLRLGLIAGALPKELEDLIKAPPPRRIEPTEVLISSGENTLFAMAAAQSKATLILSQEGHAVGKDYADVSGFFRLTATHDGPAGVELRFVPELHHGPVQHRYAADASTNPFSVQQFVMKDGQQEDTLRELAAGLSLRPGQTAVIGCLPDRPGSLGHFLMTEPEANSDRLLQKVLLVRASQVQADNPTFGASPSPDQAETPGDDRSGQAPAAAPLADPAVTQASATSSSTESASVSPSTSLGLRLRRLAAAIRRSPDRPTSP